MAVLHITWIEGFEPKNMDFAASVKPIGNDYSGNSEDQTTNSTTSTASSQAPANVQFARVVLVGADGYLNVDAAASVGGYFLKDGIFDLIKVAEGQTINVIDAA